MMQHVVGNGNWVAGGDVRKRRKRSHPVVEAALADKTRPLRTILPRTFATFIETMESRKRPSTVAEASTSEPASIAVETPSARLTESNVVSLVMTLRDGSKRQLDLTGSISITITGSCESLSTVSGDVTVQGSAGSVSSTSGNIAVGGDVRGSCSASHGEITVQGSAGSVESTTGNIVVGGDVKGSCIATHGDITQG